jgi:hypothetical protein
VAALLGGTLGWVQGMLWRTGPVLVGLREPPARLATLTFAAGQLGTAVAFAGACLPYGRTATGLYNAGLATVAVAFGGHLLGLGLFRAPRAGDASASTTLWILRAGSAMGLLFSALALGHAGMELAGGGAPKLLHDGARHALGLGFLTLVVFGMAGRILPVFSGAKLRLPRLHAAGAGLVLLAALMRQAEVAAGLGGSPELLRLSGASGFVALAGVLACVTSLLATLRARPADPPHVLREVPISPHAIVADLVAAHPAALPILIEAGFTPLANPVLRRTLARTVTLGQACRMQRIDVDVLVERLRSAEGVTR